MLIRVGFSADPDDAFMFWGLASGTVDARGYEFEPVIEDIQTLNEWSLEGRLEVTAMSAATYPLVQDTYVLLPHGASIGSGYGPVVVAREQLSLDELRGTEIVIPGELTTAFLVLKMALGADVAAGDVSAQRQRQAGLEQPPLAQVDDLLQALGLVRELALVDQQAGIGSAGLDLVEDLVERHRAIAELAHAHPQHEERGRQLARDGDLDIARVGEGHLLPRDHDRPVAGAHRGAVRQQHVALLHERIGGERDRGDLELAVDCPGVQRLDVAQDVLELEAPRIDLARGEAPEHERVVGVGAVAETDQHGAQEATAIPPYTGRVAKPGLSESIQDYLKQLYHLQSGDGRVSVTALAREQKVSPASASAMVKKLAALELVEHAPYRGVRLTRAGEKVAIEVIRHHRLLELYLARTLGLHVDAVHDEADRLEHVLSDELEAKIDSALGYPTHDPHGDPIPNADLEWPK